MDSTDFITALSKAQEAGVAKDDFLRVWNMEAKLRLLREVEKSKGLEQQEGKLQSSETSNQGKINDELRGNHKQPQNSTSEAKKSPGLPEVKAYSKDLDIDIPHNGENSATSIDAALIFQTYKLKENFDHIRKEVAEEMHQVRDELKSLKDTLHTRCQKRVHDKLWQEISDQKQELAGLREDLEQCRDAFRELKETVLVMSKKLEEANNMGSPKVSVAQNINDLERRSAVMDARGISSSAVDAETQTFDDNNKQTVQISEIPTFPMMGSVFEVKDFRQRLTEKEPMMVSPLYRLPNSSKTVSLCVWFSVDRKLNVQLLVFGLDEQSAEDKEVYSVTGQIKHGASGHYSLLFEGMQKVSKCLSPILKVNASVCLKTSRGHYENISLDELEKRRYVCDNSLFIKWFVTCKKQSVRDSFMDLLTRST